VSPSLITPIILCGGAGTRLWPLSRATLAKQFAPLVGPVSTFRQVVSRVSNRHVFAEPIIITNSDYRFIVAEELRACGATGQIVLEPMLRDSGPAITAGTELASRRDKAALLLVLASDHVVPNPEDFVATCCEASEAAANGWIVTFGIQPRSPATAYGYIRPGDRLNGSAVLAVSAFAEKPDANMAVQYCADGYLWNTGNFLFRADIMLEEVARLEPEIARAAKLAVDAATKDLDFLRLADQPFKMAPRKSIDYAVMERTTRAAVIPAKYQWSDVGNWDEVWRVGDHDENDNVTDGPVELVDTRGSLVRSEDGILTTVVGCEDIVVVSAADAVLIIPRNQAERVKSLVEGLRNRNRSEAIEHRRVLRPWGYYQQVDAGSRYQVKRIVVEPGSKLSLQKHLHRAEHWVIVKGTAEITVGSQAKVVHENESIYVPIGSMHRLANPGKISLELIEVQVGSYLREDDIIRIEDVYGRQDLI
jgi:mannose-1-phosphate guanylyltransferase / mannose-6-phosphate isomerase